MLPEELKKAAELKKALLLLDSIHLSMDWPFILGEQGFRMTWDLVVKFSKVQRNWCLDLNSNMPKELRCDLPRGHDGDCNYKNSKMRRQVPVGWQVVNLK